MGKPNPQNLKPFPKGVSGNPKGRPKTPDELKALAQIYSVDAIERLAHWLMSDNPKASVSSAEKLLERGWGKAAQPLEHSGEIGIPDNRKGVIERLIERNKK